MKWDTEDRSSHFLHSLAIIAREGAEPETKREGSAEPYLVVQFHPAPPSLRVSRNFMPTAKWERFNARFEK